MTTPQKEEGCPLCGCPIGRHPLRDPHKKYEALMAAAKALHKVDAYETLHWAGRDIADSADGGSKMAANAMKDMRDALAALRVAGTYLEDKS